MERDGEAETLTLMDTDGEALGDGDAEMLELSD
jgi:hypothetical protein